MSRRGTFCCSVCSVMFCVDNKFANFIHFCFWSVLIIWCNNPTLMTIISSPTCSHYGSFYWWCLDKSLNYTWLVSHTQNRTKNSLHFTSWNYFNIISRITRLWINKQVTFFKTATNSFSKAFYVNFSRIV